jgi:C4-dicarboxylate-specific signal transduction histidine kinase
MKKSKSRTTPEKKGDLLKYLLESEKYAQIGRLASGLAHNLQSPLTAIKGYAQLVQIDQGYIEELELIVKEVRLIQQITHTLMCKMRYIQDHSVRPVALNEMIQTEIDYLQAHLTFKHKIKKHTTFDAELPMIQGRPADFSQMIGSLILDRIDAIASSREKVFFIETSHDPSRVFVKIRDTGAAPQDHDPDGCFNPVDILQSYMDDEEDPMMTSNGGLGLTAVRMLIPRYGSVDVRAEGSFTEITLALPYDRETVNP